MGATARFAAARLRSSAATRAFASFTCLVSDSLLDSCAGVRGERGRDSHTHRSRKRGLCVRRALLSLRASAFGGCDSRAKRLKAREERRGEAAATRLALSLELCVGGEPGCRSLSQRSASLLAPRKLGG